MRTQSARGRSGTSSLISGQWAGLAIGVCLLLCFPTGGLAGASRSTIHAPPGALGAAPTALSGLMSSPRGGAGTAARAVPAIAASLVWVNVSQMAPRSAPPQTRAGSMAYDAFDGETVSFGGCVRLVCGTNQTWSFSGGTWLNLTDPQNAPPARYGATMDYDANLHGLLLFGGYGVGSYLNDTWLFQAGVWTNLTLGSAKSPPARVDASMAFDPDVEENGSVLFGGYEPGLASWANDTWVWQGGSGWALLRPLSPAPPPSGHTQMAYDPADGAIVLFGCGYGGCAVANQTWEFYSGAWWHVLPPNPAPPYRSDAAMTYDAALSAIVLFGGAGAAGSLNDTWTFAHGSWSKLSAGIPPPARSSAMISSGSSEVPPVLFGGSNGRISSLNDTWVLEAPLTLLLSATPTRGETSTSVTVGVGVSGGTAPYRAVVAFGDGTSAVATVAAVSLLPPPFVQFGAAHTYLKAGFYSPSVNLIDGAGALGASRVVPALQIVAGPAPVASAEPAVGDVGVMLAFLGGPVLNGTAPFGFVWSFGDGGTATGRDANHTYATAGTFRGNLTVNDSVGGTAVANFTEIIHSRPTVTVADAPRAAVAGTPTTFYGNVSGGTAPYRYSWKFGDGGTSSVPSPRHNFSAAGSSTVQLWVNDSLGSSAHQTLVVSVAPAQPTPPATGSGGGSSSAPWWFWPGVGALIAGGVTGSLLLALRGRSTSRG